MNQSNANDLKFHVKVSDVNGTFTAPSTAVATTLQPGQLSKGGLSRLVAAGSYFHAFVPTLNQDYLPIEINRHRGILNPQTNQVAWDAPQLLYGFDPPLSYSPADYCRTTSQCRRIYYAAAHLDARGTPAGNWAVAFSKGEKVGSSVRYNNVYLCTSDQSRGCGAVNPFGTDEFLPGVAVSDQPGSGVPTFWVSYLAYSSFNQFTNIGSIPLISQAVYYLPGQPGVGATTRSGILPTYWMIHLAKCTGLSLGCYAAGDYVGISANPFLAASTPIIDKKDLRNGLGQLFVQDPETPQKGQTFSIPWKRIPYGTVDRLPSTEPSPAPGSNPGLRRGPLSQAAPPVVR